MAMAVGVENGLSIVFVAAAYHTAHEAHPCHARQGVSHRVKRDGRVYIGFGLCCQMASAPDIHHHQRYGKVAEQTLSRTAL